MVRPIVIRAPWKSDFGWFSLVLHAIRFPRNELMVSYKLTHQCLNQILAAALQGKGETTQVIHSLLLACLPNLSECNFLL